MKLLLSKEDNLQLLVHLTNLVKDLTMVNAKLLSDGELTREELFLIQNSIEDFECGRLEQRLDYAVEDAIENSYSDLDLLDHE